MAGVVTSGILFAINTTGGGKAKLQFMAVAAGVAIAAKAFVSFTKDAQSLHQTFIQLSDANRMELAELEKLNKGIIDTGATMKMFATLNKAGMEETGDLMKAMTKIVIDEGQKTGKTAQQITEDFIQLGEGIAKGSGRALKKFGVDLQETEDLLLMQEEALWKVQDRAAGITIELKTLSEQTFAAKNSWDTYTQLLWGSIGKKGAVTGVITALDDASEAMILAGENTRLLAQADYIAALAGERFRLSLFGQTEQAARYNTVINGLLESMRRVAEIDATVEKFAAGVSLAGGGFAETAMPWEDVSVDIGAFAEQKTKAKSFQEAAKKKPRRGGGGKRDPGFDEGRMNFAEIDVALTAQEYLLGKAVKETNVAFFERQDIYEDLITTQDEKWQKERDINEASRQLEIEHREWSAQFREEDWQRDLEAKEAAQQLEIEHHEWLLLNSEQYAAKQAEIDRQAAQARLSQFAAAFTNLSSLMQAKNRTAFYIGKAAAYASTVIKTAQASMNAFEGMTRVIPGPAGLIAGGVAAGAATAAGAIQLATIRRQEFGSAGGGVSSGAVGTSGGGYLGGGGGYAAGAGTAQTTHVTVILGEEEFHGWTIDANKKASQSGKPAFATEEAA
jgi:hypothetical protein